MSRLSLLTGKSEKPIPKTEPKADPESLLIEAQKALEELRATLNEERQARQTAESRAAAGEALAAERAAAFKEEGAKCALLQATLLEERGARERAEGELAAQNSAVLRLEQQVRLALSKNLTLPAPTVIQAPADQSKPVSWEIHGKRQDGSVMKMTVTPVEKS